jgi:hypothetical protein
MKDSDLISDFTSGFVYLTIPRGASKWIKCVGKCNFLFFTLSGEVQLFSDEHEYILKKGTVCFRAIPFECRITAMESDVKMIVDYCSQPADLSEKLAISDLSSYLTSNTISKQTLEIHSGIYPFLTDLILDLDEGDNDGQYFDAKQQELVSLLRAYYSRKQLANLFAPIVCNDLFEYAYHYVCEHENDRKA